MFVCVAVFVSCCVCVLQSVCDFVCGLWSQAFESNSDLNKMIQNNIGFDGTPTWPAAKCVCLP